MTKDHATALVDKWRQEAAFARLAVAKSDWGSAHAKCADELLAALAQGGAHEPAKMTDAELFEHKARLWQQDAERYAANAEHHRMKREEAEAALAASGGAQGWQQENEQLRALIRWALGEHETDEFPSLPDDWPRRKFYWRGELRKRFEAIVPPTGETP